MCRFGLKYLSAGHKKYNYLKNADVIDVSTMSYTEWFPLWTISDTYENK